MVASKIAVLSAKWSRRSVSLCFLVACFSVLDLYIFVCWSFSNGLHRLLINERIQFDYCLMKFCYHAIIDGNENRGTFRRTPFCFSARQRAKLCRSHSLRFALLLFRSVPCPFQKDMQFVEALPWHKRGFIFDSSTLLAHGKSCCWSFLVLDVAHRKKEIFSIE